MPPSEPLDKHWKGKGWSDGNPVTRVPQADGSIAEGTAAMAYGWNGTSGAPQQLQVDPTTGALLVSSTGATSVGPPGPTGPTGPAGPIGPAGPTGPAGPAGTVTSLAANVSAGATTLNVNSTSGVAVGQYIAVSSGLANCEARRIVSIAGTTLTLSAAFKFDHSSGDQVPVIDDFVTFEMYGAVADAVTDSYPNLRNALLDQQTHAMPIVGHGEATVNAYATSRPLWFNDYCVLMHCSFTTRNWAIDNMQGGWQDGRPCQYMFTQVGNSGTIVWDYTTGTFKITGDQCTVDQEVQFYPQGQGAALPAGTFPNGIEEGRKYWITSRDGSGNCKVSLKRADTANPVTFTSNGSGTTRFYGAGQSKMLCSYLNIAGNFVRGLSGVMTTTAQPQTSTHVRVMNFPVAGVTMAAAQGYLEEWMIYRSYVGLELSGAFIMTVHGCDIENCSHQVALVKDRNSDTQVAQNVAVAFTGVTHMEGTAGGPATKKTIYRTGTAALTGGTFTITFRGVTTTHNWNDDPATIKAALVAGNHYITTNDVDVYGSVDYINALAAGTAPVYTRTGITLNQQAFIFDFEQAAGQYYWADISGGNVSWPKDPSGTGHAEFVVGSSTTGGTVANTSVYPWGSCFLVNNGQGVTVQHAYGMTNDYPNTVYGTPWYNPIPFVRFGQDAIDATNGPTHTFSLDMAYYGSAGQGMAVAFDPLYEPGNHFVWNNYEKTKTSSLLYRVATITNYRRYGPFTNADVRMQAVHWAGMGGRALSLGAGSSDPWLQLSAGNGQTTDIEQWLTYGAASPSGGVTKDGYLYSPRLYVASSTAGPLILSGTGAPEGVVTAPIGSLFMRTDGGTGTAVYRKESGSGNTGWVATGAATATIPAPIDVNMFAMNVGTSWAIPAAITEFNGTNRTTYTRADLTGATQVRLVCTLESGGSPNKAVTAVSTAADTLTITAHGLVANQSIMVGPNIGNCATPLNNDTVYFVIVVDANTIQVSATRGGAAIDLTGTGSSMVIYTSTLGAQYSTDASTYLWLDGTASSSLPPGGAITMPAGLARARAGPWYTLPSGPKADVWLKAVGMYGDGSQVAQINNVKLQVK